MAVEWFSRGHQSSEIVVQYHMLVVVVLQQKKWKRVFSPEFVSSSTEKQECIPFFVM